MDSSPTSHCIVGHFLVLTPPELLQQIFHYAAHSFRDALHLRSVCRKFCQAVADSELWASICSARWHFVSGEFDNISNDVESDREESGFCTDDPGLRICRLGYEREVKALSLFSGSSGFGQGSGWIVYDAAKYSSGSLEFDSLLGKFVSSHFDLGIPWKRIYIMKPCFPLGGEGVLVRDRGGAFWLQEDGQNVEIGPTQILDYLRFSQRDGPDQQVVFGKDSIVHAELGEVLSRKLFLWAVDGCLDQFRFFRFAVFWVMVALDARVRFVSIFEDETHRDFAACLRETEGDMDLGEKLGAYRPHERPYDHENDAIFRKSFFAVYEINMEDKVAIQGELLVFPGGFEISFQKRAYWRRVATIW